MTRYMAVCDECREVHFFISPEAKEHWMNNHHQEEE